MLPGVVGSERGGLSVEGIAIGQTCAINLVGNRYLLTDAAYLYACNETYRNDM